MIVFVDDSGVISEYYSARFVKLGMSIEKFSIDEFFSWIVYASDDDLSVVEAFIFCGPVKNAKLLFVKARSKSNAPLIAVLEEKDSSLQNILELFNIGADDVVKKQIDVKEIMARIAAIYRRKNNITEMSEQLTVSDIQVYTDGRDPKIKGEDFILPRRERRILEFLIANKGTRVSRPQLFNAVYGLFETCIDESVIASHVSKLRKKLKSKLGYDIIDSKRFLGYMIKQPKI